MFEDRPQSLRQRVADLSAQAIESGDPTQWFEQLYQDSQGDTGQIPWAKLAPHPYLQEWLATQPFSSPQSVSSSQPQHEPQKHGAGHRALVIGCGLGDDAEALAALGFDVTAFDVAPTAIAWCHQRFPDTTVTYQVADLFYLPSTWDQAFDLVIEIRDIQALPLTVRSAAIQATAATVAPGGTLFVVTRIRPSATPPDGPPWPLSDEELAQFQEQGLEECDRLQLSVSEQPPVEQVRLIYRRPISIPRDATPTAPT